MSTFPLWRRSVEVFRRQFEEASFRHPGLQVFTSEAVEDDEDALRHLNEPPPGLSVGPPSYFPDIGLGQPARFRELTAQERDLIGPEQPGVLRDPRDKKPLAVREPGTTRVICFHGDVSHAREQFISLARGMGRLLPSMPREYTRLIPAEVIWHAASHQRQIGPFRVIGGPPDPISEGREHRRWVQAVFEIAWLRLPESPLRAKRLSWKEQTTFPYDAAELSILKNSGFMAELFKDVPAQPKHFFSELPVNAFLASVLAIDALLEAEPQTHRDAGSLLAWAGSDTVNLAIVFTDLKGGTRLRKDIGDEAMGDLVQAHYARARTHIRHNGGRLIKTTGDGVLAVFRNAGAAMNFALGFSADTGDQRLRIRSCVHVDQVFIEDDDVAGRSIAYAARMLEGPRDANIRVSEAARTAIVDRKAPEHDGLVWTEQPLALKDFGADERIWVVERLRSEADA